MTCYEFLRGAAVALLILAGVVMASLVACGLIRWLCIRRRPLKPTRHWWHDEDDDPEDGRPAA
jgi:hypothetical protein